MPTFEHGYALLVGVGADLQFTTRDAERVGELLCDKGRCGYPRENVRLLLGPDANHQALVNCLRWLQQCALNDPFATVVFYYSGHGLAEPASTLVLNPCFGPDNRPDPAKYSTEGISGQKLCQELEAIVSRKLLVLLDCCYAAGQASFFKEPGREPNFLHQLRAGSGRIALASSSDSEVSQADGKESYFTAALIEALAGYNSFSGDGYARVFEVTDYVQRKVRSRTREAQHPIFLCNTFDENFAIAYYSGGDPRPKDLSPFNPVSGPRHIRRETEAEKEDFQLLERAQEDARRLEDKIARSGGFSRAPAELQRESRAIDRRVVHLEANLGLLEQQSPFSRQLASWFTGIGVFTFLSTLYCVLGTQRTFSGIADTLPTSFALLGLVLGTLGLFTNFVILEYFQQKAGRGDWFHRLPVPFGLRTIFSNPGFARMVQIASLIVFFALPIYYQGHFLNRASEGTVHRTIPRSNLPPLKFDLEITGLEHLSHYFGFADSVFTGWYWLGTPGKLGVSFFPFWQPWFFVITFFAVIALFFRTLLRLARIEDGRPLAQVIRAWRRERQVGLAKEP